MMDIREIAGDAKRDIRAELPKLMEQLGVNTEDEHQVFHASLVWLVKELAKTVPTLAAVTDIAKVL